MHMIILHCGRDPKRDRPSRYLPNIDRGQLEPFQDDEH
jgi:hypothetical protein